MFQRIAAAAAAVGLCAGLAPAVAAAEGMKPEAVDFARDLPATEAALQSVCSSQETRAITPAQIPGVTEQKQIDCDGFDFFGKGRRAEFVFGDGELVLVWILTEAADEAQLIAAFKDAYGAPTHETADMVAFADDHAAVRRDKPEALFYSPAVAEPFRARFDAMAAGAAQ